jgi:hypothetical protein
MLTPQSSCSRIAPSATLLMAGRRTKQQRTASWRPGYFGTFADAGSLSVQARRPNPGVARLARSAARTRKQSVPPRSARHGDSANPQTRKREHNRNVLHQDCCRRCSQGDDEARKPHSRRWTDSIGHRWDTRKQFACGAFHGSVGR